MNATYPPEMLPSPDEGDEVEIIIERIPAGGYGFGPSPRCVLTLDAARKLFPPTAKEPVE